MAHSCSFSLATFGLHLTVPTQGESCCCNFISAIFQGLHLTHIAFASVVTEQHPRLCICYLESYCFLFFLLITSHIWFLYLIGTVVDPNPKQLLGTFCFVNADHLQISRKDLDICQWLLSVYKKKTLRKTTLNFIFRSGNHFSSIKLNSHVVIV